MEFVYFIFFTSIIALLLVYFIAVKIELVINSFSGEANMKIFWLKPFLKVMITIDEFAPILSIYIFHMKIYKGRISIKSNGKENKINLFKKTKISDVNIALRYGFKDPFTTGIACAAVTMASQFINIETLENSPDFLNENEYICLDARARINIGKTFTKLINVTN